MMGYNHVSCGLRAGLATLPIAPVHTPAAQAAWVIALGGASLLPDLDSTGATASRMCGPTRLLATGITTIARGHRGGTHDAIVAPAAFAAVAMVLAIMIGLSLQGLVLAGLGRIGAPLNIAASAGAAWWLVTHGAHQIQLLPLVMAAGVLVHIAGDWMTTEGVPIPLAWLTGNEHRLSLSLFSVNGAVERWLIAPVLSMAVLILLGYHLRPGIHRLLDTLRTYAIQLAQ